MIPAKFPRCGGYAYITKNGRSIKVVTIRLTTSRQGGWLCRNAGLAVPTWVEPTDNLHQHPLEDEA